MTKRLDITGQLFGRLTAIEPVGKTNRRMIIWRFRCSCGNETTAPASSVKCGNTTSCGCYKAEQIKKGVTRHGRSKTSEYRTWTAMKERCYYEQHKDYHIYGGKGVRVCDQWINDFPRFLEDMGRKPSPRHTIERNESSKDYTPENCRWALPIEQANNTSRNHYLEYKGQRMTLSQWARHLGVSRGLLKDRITKLHWSVEDALTIPPHRKQFRKEEPCRHV